MKKKIVSLFLVFSIVGLFGCSKKDESPKIENGNKDDKQLFLQIVEDVENYQSFYTVTEGETVSLGITQKIRAERYVVGDIVFKETASCSAIVKTATQTYADGEKFLIRKSEKINSVDNVEWENEVESIERKEYLNRYGSLITGLNNYVLNEQTVVSVSKEQNENGYTFKVLADKESATVNIVKEMKTNAGSVKEPTFGSVYFEVFTDVNLTIKSVKYKGNYNIKIALLGEVDCEENITETFYGINKTETFPEKEFFE